MSVEESVELEILKSRMLQYAKRARALGVEPGVEMTANGNVRVVRTIPRELRETMRAALASVGVGVLIELALDATSQETRLSAVRAMIEGGLGRAKTSMGESGDLAHPAGVIMFPVVPLAPQPPPAMLSGGDASGHTLAAGARIEAMPDQQPPTRES